MENKSLFEGNLKKTFFKFAIPSIIGMLIVSIQVMVDGLFIANYIGSEGLAAVNLIMPYVNLVMASVMMVSIGGSVVTSTYLGNGNIKKGRETFSLAFYTFLAISFVILVLSLLFKDNIATFLGSNEALFPLVREYLIVMIVLAPLFNLPIFMETYSRVAEKPNLVFISGFICFSTNVILDYLFLAKFNMGIGAAGIASAIANGLGGLYLAWHIIGKGKTFELTKVKIDIKVISGIVYNGSSEMFSVIAASITTLLFNIILMERVGQMGVSALTIVLYVNSIVSITLFGLSQALQPIVSYNIGARNIDAVYETLKIALRSGAIIGIVTFILMKFFSPQLVSLFVKGDMQLMDLTMEIVHYFIFAYLISFANIVASAFHTAIEKPMESVVIALARSLVFVVIFLYVLPPYLGNIGIWLATPVAEAATLVVSLYYFKKSFDSLDKLQVA